MFCFWFFFLFLFFLQCYCLDPTEPAPAPGLLDWKIIHEKMSWGVIILLGGGFALADACKVRYMWVGRYMYRSFHVFDYNSCIWRLVEI